MERALLQGERQAELDQMEAETDIITQLQHVFECLFSGMTALNSSESPRSFHWVSLGHWVCPNEACTHKEPLFRHSSCSIQLSVTTAPPKKRQEGGERLVSDIFMCMCWEKSARWGLWEILTNQIPAPSSGIWDLVLWGFQIGQGRQGTTEDTRERND